MTVDANIAASALERSSEQSLRCETSNLPPCFQVAPVGETDRLTHQPPGGHEYPVRLVDALESFDWLLSALLGYLALLIFAL
jgi:hypothetical protein